MKAYILLIIVALVSFSSFALAVEEQQQQPLTEKETQERLKQLEKEIDQMRKTKDPQQRRHMMDEHMGHMRGMMNDMGCCAEGEGQHGMQQVVPKQ
jgi:ABC-type transporter MlaC component